MRSIRRFALVPTLLLAAALPALAGDVLTPHSVAKIRSVTSAAISPDGKSVAYVVSVPREPMADEDGAPWAELHVLDWESGTSRPFVTGKQNVSNVEWTADGRGIAFTAKRGKDEATCLYVIALDGGEARKAAELSGDIGGYDLAPDGERVALVGTEKKSKEKKALEEKGFKQEIYEEDWTPAKVWVARLYELDSEKKLEALEGSVHAVKWSPVADKLAISVAPTPLVDDSYVRTRVHVVDAADGKLAAHCDNPGKLGDFAWSPDGKSIAMVAGVDIHDPAAECLLVAPATGGAPRDVLPGYEGKIEAIAWQDADTVMYVASRGCWSVLEKLDLPPNAAPKRLVDAGGPILTSLSLSKDGQRAVFLANSPSHASELFTMKHGDKAPERRTDSNPWLADVRLGRQEVVNFEARDGLALEGVLIRPLDEVKGDRYPLILYVHGGPEAHHSNGWLTGYGNPGQVAAARGFAVMHTNYRGSTGRGVAFSKSSQGDPAGKEFDDLIDAVDHLAKTGLVDPAKVAVTGGSYGGYATAWLSTRYTDRIAAGVMFVGISDKLSKVGTTDIPDEEYYVHARKRPWEAWQFLLERSPIYHAGQCTTPLLILHGKDDPRVNPGQSRELHRHLKMHGKAPVRLVFYPGEGHGNRKAAARLDYSLRSLQWIEHYIAGPRDAPPPPFEIDYAAPKGDEAAPVSASSAAQ
jgi:dipeptidyl aminopeptidase/acylaminoacyl peptidase